MHRRPLAGLRPAPLLLILCTALSLPACDSRPDPSVIQVDTASRSLTDEIPGAQSVTLPDTWPTARRRESREGRYESTFELRAQPTELWAISLPGVDTNASVRVNGVAVGHGGHLGANAPVGRNRHRPLHFTIPAELLRGGRNTVAVRLVVEPSSLGRLAPFQLGPDRVLRPSHEARLFAQITLVQMEALFAVAVALLLAMVYARREEHAGYRYAALAAALWAVGLLDVFVRDIPVPTRIWVWLQGTAQYSSVACLMFAFHRVLRVDRGRFEQALAMVNGAASVALLAAPTAYAVPVLLGWGALTFATGGYGVAFLARARRAEDPLLGWRMLPVGLFGLALGGHDLVSGLAGRPLLGMWLVPYLGVPGLVVLAWGVMRNLVNGLHESENLNEELETRVTHKHMELAESYGRLRRLECAQAIHRERERIVRDMHDGMGGQLVSTLALVESGDAPLEQVAQALREALADLRLVIDSLDPDEGEILAGLALIRSRLESRLARDGLRFDWQVAELPELEEFGPEKVLNTMRIVQEALTNVLKHADADCVRLRTGVLDRRGLAGIFIEISDDGAGIDPARKRGRGMLNMERRARELGGSLDVESGGWGTSLVLWIPVARRPTEAD